MIKKRARLSLNKETIRELQKTDLEAAVGGVLKISIFRCSFTDPYSNNCQQYPCPSDQVCQ